MTYLPQKFVGLAAITALGASLSFAVAKTASGPASKSSKSAHHSTKKSHKARARGQQAIDSERCREIQQALVREHYMTGQPSGTWDDTTQQAMRRYQADQGWQNKTVPDSRALIRLGLGPNHEHLLNPETAMTMSSSPVTSHVASRSTVKASTATSNGGASMPASSAQVSAPSSMSAVPAR